VAETAVSGGNNRVQVFESIRDAHGDAPTPFNPRLSLTTQLGLNQPNAVAQVADLLAENIYIADTGNDRVIKTTLPETTPPGDAWAAMKTHIVSNGNIPGAASQFCASTGGDYLRAFLSIGITKLTADVNAIGTLTPVYVEGNKAQYYFEQTIQGNLLLFPVDFIKENGKWKIMSF
jgi:hypothetical protein